MTAGDTYRLAKTLYDEFGEELIYMAAERALICARVDDKDGAKHWEQVGRFATYLHTGKVGK